jgi:pimeloyl-ACP methyl ester carboxylesterase
LIGSAYEKIKDSYEDIHAWIQAARQWGFQRIAIAGHSLGAIKAGYYVQHASSNNDEKVELERLILISPPRLRHETLRDDPKYGTTYQDDLSRAEQIVRSGGADSLLQIKFPQPLVISAGTYLDKYGTANEYDYMAWAHRIPAANWIFGELEVRGTRRNFADCDKLLQNSLGTRIVHTIDIIPNGDHNYTEARSHLAAKLKELATAKS